MTRRMSGIITCAILQDRTCTIRNNSHNSK